MPHPSSSWAVTSTVAPTSMRWPPPRFICLTGSPPFQHTNPAVVISQHLSASPPPPSATGVRTCRRSTRYWPRRWRRTPTTGSRGAADFARALGHRLGDVPPDATRLSRRDGPAQGQGARQLRPAVVIPAVLAILLVAAIGFALLELNRADDERPASPARTTTVTSAPSAVPSPRPLRVQGDAVAPTPEPPPSAATSTPATTVDTPTSTAAAAPRRGDRRRLLAARQHGHDRQRLDGLLFDAAEHRRQPSGR